MHVGQSFCRPLVEWRYWLIVVYQTADGYVVSPLYGDVYVDSSRQYQYDDTNQN